MNTVHSQDLLQGLPALRLADDVAVAWVQTQSKRKRKGRALLVSLDVQFSFEFFEPNPANQRTRP